MSINDTYIRRAMEQPICKALDRNRSILLLGPRQAGKTTIVKKLEHDRYISLLEPRARLRYESDPSTLMNEIKQLKLELNRIPLVIIDEVQKVPKILDVVQLLIDDDEARFILTGSSARKIKNLLPGRVIKKQLTSLSIDEDHNCSLNDLLLFGALPRICTLQNNEDKEEELKSYVELYLEEEIRKEAIVRDLGKFHNFLQLAAVESGNSIHYRKLSQELGNAHTTIAEYYQILKDCMMIELIEPLTKSNTRRKLTHAPKFIFFDLGIRRVTAEEGLRANVRQMSLFFEQFVGLELKKLLYKNQLSSSLYYWRDHAGPEVDYVIPFENKYIPIEVKWTDRPSLKDAKHLLKFQNEYPVTEFGYIICQTPNDLLLSDSIKAISWQNLEKILLKQQ